MSSSVLMVCLGNICRSPMAEGLLRYYSEKEGLYLNIDSAGTGGWHSGEAPDHRAVKKMQEKGIDISGLKARQFKLSDFSEFDHIFTMDNMNYRDLLLLAKNENHQSKVELILNRLNPGAQNEVPDPYYGGMEEFEHVFHLLEKACLQIIKDIKSNAR